MRDLRLVMTNRRPTRCGAGSHAGGGRIKDDLSSTGPELSDRSPSMGSRLFIAVVLIGAALSVTLGVYGHEHTPTGRAIITFGFPTLLGMKAWLATGALAFGVVQALTAHGCTSASDAGPPSTLWRSPIACRGSRPSC
jgi:hypothetical protein